MTTIPITLLPHAHDLPLPAYATEQSAGMDLMAAVMQDTTIAAGTWQLVKTGIAIALPESYEAQVRPRSGLALKHGVTVLNAPGTIDADYRGEIGVMLMNHGRGDFTVTRGMRIAQLVIAPYTRASWQLSECLTESTRGTGGFGSTGTQLKHTA